MDRTGRHNKSEVDHDAGQNGNEPGYRICPGPTCGAGDNRKPAKHDRHHDDRKKQPSISAVAENQGESLESASDGIEPSPGIKISIQGERWSRGENDHQDCGKSETPVQKAIRHGQLLPQSAFGSVSWPEAWRLWGSR